MTFSCHWNGTVNTRDIRHEYVILISDLKKNTTKQQQQQQQFL